MRSLRPDENRLRRSDEKSKNSIYIRYEFSDESGTPEGGDILCFSSMKEIQDFTSEILAVAHGDQVSAAATIGREKPFMGFLSSVGVSKKNIEKERRSARRLKLLRSKPRRKLRRKRPRLRPKPRRSNL